MFHVYHNWTIVKETFAPPVKEGKYWDTRGAMELQCGLTTILFQCSICKKLRKEEMLGQGK